MTYLTGGLAAQSNVDAGCSGLSQEITVYLSQVGLSGDKLLQSRFPLMTVFG